MGELRRIPGIGAAGERDLLELGYTTVQSLAGADPEEMYARECARKGVRVDRCVLYVYRCAVYYASTPQPDPEKLKWWAWKDGGEENHVNDVLKMKKAHPCGSQEWLVLRVGMDFKMRCQGCGHEVMLPRSKAEKNIRKVFRDGEPVEV